MRSLFVRFFLSFWLIIGITIGTAAIGGFWYAENVREAIEKFESSSGDHIRAASRALQTGGRESLANWLRTTQENVGITIFVFDERGHDILDRGPPFDARRQYRRFREHERARRRFHDDDEHDGEDEDRRIRHFRPLPQVVSPSGDVYTFVAMPSRGPYGAWTIADARYFLLILALIISGLVSYGLAKAIARPVNKLRSATVSLAEGNLDTRVAESVGKRRDELGMLGRDFDSMAETLQKAVLQQAELSRNISHELRSPLARMRVAIEIAKRDAGEISELERLELEAERLDSLIGQILSYTRLESGTGLETVDLDLADVLQEVSENVNFECRSDNFDGVKVVTKIDDVPLFTGNRDALISGVENVLRNAVAHSPPDSEVSATLKAEDGNAVIEICDQGDGVDEQDLAKLFEPFFRTRRSAESATHQGTGLGLAIAARAIQVNGGRISARNAPGSGLVMRIVLPVSRDS